MENKLNKNSILSLLKTNKEYIQKNFSVSRIGLFGSYAKDQAKGDSDIDIYVEFEDKNFKNISGLWVFLEELYHKKVDLLHKHKRSKGAIFESIQKEVIYG